MASKLSPRPVDSDPAYHDFEQLVAANVTLAKGPLFTTEATGGDDLFHEYLAGLPVLSRQHYNCHCCRGFMKRYGGLVTIDPEGHAEPLLWDADAADVPDFFRDSVANMENRLARSKVTGVFLSADPVWGTPATGAWTHLHGKPAQVCQEKLKTASQAAAEKLEEYGMLRRGLAEFPRDAAAQAVRVLEADAVERSEKALGVAKWLLALHDKLAEKHDKRRQDNLAWLAVATAPPGWCHVKTTMIGTLLEDVVAGLDYEVIHRKWAEKMNPLQYLRPSAPLKAGQVAAANSVVEKLRSAGALRRRYARLGDVLTKLWVPVAEEPAGKPAGGGAFDHLLPKAGGKVREVHLPAQKWDWDRFQAVVLPTALALECGLPTGAAGFYGLVTAAEPEAPAVIQWDGLAGLRNPVTWYFHAYGSQAHHWGLISGSWTEVTAVFEKPFKWQRPDQFTHHDDGTLFLALRGAREQVTHRSGGLFPDHMRSEYHGVRAAIEAYSQSAEITGREEGDANGIALAKGKSLTLRVRARGAASWVEYEVSR